MATEGRKYLKKQFLFTGEWIPDQDPLKIGEQNYSELENYRYNDVGLEAVFGYTKINTKVLTTYLKGRSGIQLLSPYSGENRVLIQAQNAAGSAAQVLENKAAVPAQGNFEATALHTDGAGAGLGQFSRWPQASIAYSNGVESMIWAGDEMRAAGFINYAPDGDFRYNYLDAILNIETDGKNVATLHRVAESIDVYTMLLLHLDNNVTDSSSTTPHTITNTNVTFSTSVKVFGTHGAVFNGTTALLSTADDPDFDFSAGFFTIDLRGTLDNLPAAGTVMPLYFQETAGTGNDWIKVYVDENGAVCLKICQDYLGAADEVVSIATANGVISAATFYHIEVAESGNHWYIFVGGIQKAHLTDASRAANYTGNIQIGYDGTDYLKGTIDEYRISNIARHTAAFEIPVSAYGSAVSATYNYLGTTRPLKAFKPYIGTANTTAGSMSVEYWNGSIWTSVSSLVDGTAVAGVPLAQTGIVSFTSTVDTAKVKVIDSKALYWYRIIITNADATTTISHLSVDAPFQAIKDIWDGIFRTAIAFQVYQSDTYNDYTLNVTGEDYSSANTATYAALNSLAAADFFVAGFEERTMAIRFTVVGGAVNTTDNTILTVYYWDGDDWVSVGIIEDGTFEDNRSFAKAGTVSWHPPEHNTEFKTEIGKGVPLYYYKFQFSQALSADVKVDTVTAITAPRNLSGGYAFPLMFQGRAMLCGWKAGKEGNRVDYAMMEAPDVWNGEDASAGARALYFGGSEDLTCGCQLYNRFGSYIYNTAILCKDHETHLLNGYDAETWRIYQISDTVGCPAPETMDTAEVGYGIAADAVRNVAVWLSYTGPVLFDGAVLVPIKQKIGCYFDKNDSRCINFDAIEASRGWVDPDNNEYNLMIPSGSGQTTCNVWLVFDLIRKRWFKKVPAGTSAFPQAAFRVIDTDGAQYVYGLRDSGYMMRLENGNTWNGQAIAQKIVTADHVPTGDVWDYTKLRRMKVAAIAISEEVSVAITHYADGKASGTSLDAFSATGTDRHKRASQSVSLKGWSHKFEFSASSSATAKGVRLLGWGYQYEVLREDN